MYSTKTNNKFHNDLFPQFDRVLNELFNTSFKHITDETKVNYTHPAANIQEFKDKFVIDLAVPGFEKNEIAIKIDKNVLILSSEKENTSEEKFKIKEFNYGNFSREFKLPETVDKTSISAELTNGLLKITLNKRSEEIDNGPKAITIS